jgi:hypothetical protein
MFYCLLTVDDSKLAKKQGTNTTPVPDFLVGDLKLLSDSTDVNEPVH